jgi:serine/threonine-protein kinase
MGQVYLARSTGLGGFERQVVVKTLDLSITDDDEAFVTMFLDEARLVGALHHQYIAPVYEVGCDEEGRYYLVMDYVNGETAEAVFRTSAERSLPVPLSFALTVVSCVASALDYAHGMCAADGTPLDIVHRDISLSNVMAGYDGAVKLIDFGIAKAANRATKTQVGTLKGKIGYLAPEQILRKHVDHRADIFSLGIVLYELTTARRAFRRGSDLITLERITSGEVRMPTELVPGYPPELERIVLKALQVDPDLRFQDAGTMGRELEALGAHLGLRLGHAAVIDVMTKLFGDQRRGRRRTARGSNEPPTDPSNEMLIIEDDEKTPVVDLAMIGEMERDSSSRQRAARPTTPIIDRSKREIAVGSQGGGIDVALDELPTPPSERALEPALIPLEDRPTSLAAPILDAAGQLLERPTPQRVPQRRTPLPLAPPQPPRSRMAEHTPSNAQPIREEVMPPVVIFRQPSHGHAATSMVARVKPAISKAARTWLFLCALFAIAVATAILIAMV